MTTFCATERAFLAAIAADLADDGPRLVYADWLDENGRTERAEFIRVQCELAALGEDGGPAEHHPRFLGLRRRERELWAGQCGVDLGAEIPRSCNFLEPRLTPVEGYDPPPPQALFRRGFVSHVTLTCQQLAGGPCEVCGGNPVRLNWRCSACHGEGRAPGCAAALGRLPGLERIELSDREPARSECPACRGRRYTAEPGTRYGTMDCPACGGTGRAGG